jgi:hypothetical protein
MSNKMVDMKGNFKSSHVIEMKGFWSSKYL